MSDKEGFEIEEVSKKRQEKRPQFAPGVLEPRYIFLMRTEKKPDEMGNKIFKEIKNHMPFLPEKTIREMIDKQLSRAGVCLFEYHTIIAAEDKKAGVWQVWTADYHNHGEKPPISRSFLVQDDEEEENAAGNARINGMRIQHVPEWEGEREKAIEIEAENYAEFLAALEADPKAKDMFLTLYPETITNDSPITAAIPTVKARSAVNRAALVKKYGEDKVQKLEKRIDEKQNKGIPE